MKSYFNVISHGYNSQGLEYSGSYLTATKMVIFGGHNARSSCMQQTGNLKNLGSKWSCLSSDETTLDLNGYSTWVLSQNIYE